MLKLRAFLSSVEHFFLKIIIILDKRKNSLHVWNATRVNDERIFSLHKLAIRYNGNKNTCENKQKIACA